MNGRRGRNNFYKKSNGWNRSRPDTGLPAYKNKSHDLEYRSGPNSRRSGSMRRGERINPEPHTQNNFNKSYDYNSSRNYNSNYKYRQTDGERGWQSANTDSRDKSLYVLYNDLIGHEELFLEHKVRILTVDGLMPIILSKYVNQCCSNIIKNYYRDILIAWCLYHKSLNYVERSEPFTLHDVHKFYSHVVNKKRLKKTDTALLTVLTYPTFLKVFETLKTFENSAWITDSIDNPAPTQAYLFTDDDRQNMKEGYQSFLHEIAIFYREISFSLLRTKLLLDANQNNLLLLNEKIATLNHPRIPDPIDPTDKKAKQLTRFFQSLIKDSLPPQNGGLNRANPNGFLNRANPNGFLNRANQNYQADVSNNSRETMFREPSGSEDSVKSRTRGPNGGLNRANHNYQTNVGRDATLNRANPSGFPNRANQNPNGFLNRATQNYETNLGNEDLGDSVRTPIGSGFLNRANQDYQSNVGNNSRETMVRAAFAAEDFGRTRIFGLGQGDVDVLPTLGCQKPLNNSTNLINPEAALSFIEGKIFDLESKFDTLIRAQCELIERIVSLKTFLEFLHDENLLQTHSDTGAGDSAEDFKDEVGALFPGAKAFTDNNINNLIHQMVPNAPPNGGRNATLNRTSHDYETNVSNED